MRIRNAPEASSLMSTARSFGNYDLASALADLIDNSIHARATKIDISFQFLENKLVVRIRDNGNGMDEATLLKAMRPASANPDDEREASDLGRFGWGLKSASLSQARVLTVVTWQKSTCYAACWDIDNLEDWEMDFYAGADAKALLDIPPTASGTEVIWTRCDSLDELVLSNGVDTRLNEKIAHANQQLALTFHRYLSGETTRKLQITLQNIELVAADPFMRQHPATQTYDEEIIALSGKNKIKAQAFIIPHFSKLNVQEKKILGGDEGLVRNQGFYVYRNKRLIIHGTWFRLLPHGELSQLTRVRIDLTNSLDKEWKITLDKSDAQLPTYLRDRLRDLVKSFAKQSTRATKKKGVDLTLKGKQPVWRRTAYQGRVKYRINTEHPMVSLLVDESPNKSFILKTIEMIESYMPLDQMTQDQQDDKKDIGQSVTDTEQFESILQQCYFGYIRHGGSDKKQAFMDYIKNIEPFASHWKYSEDYITNQFAKKWRLN